jgi:hypothetical protein
MGMERSMNGGEKNAYGMLVGKPEETTRKTKT